VCTLAGQVRYASNNTQAIITPSRLKSTEDHESHKVAWATSESKVSSYLNLATNHCIIICNMIKSIFDRDSSHYDATQRQSNPKVRMCHVTSDPDMKSVP
jgi:hypothetical protein